MGGGAARLAGQSDRARRPSSETQRVAFKHVVAASLKAGRYVDDLVLVEAALTRPYGWKRMPLGRCKLIRQATAAVQTPLAQFYETLDSRQKTRFAEMN